MAKRKNKGKSIIWFLLAVAILYIIKSGWLDNIFKISGLKEGVVTDAPLSIHVIDVGQGESILIKGPDKNMLIDAGESGNGLKICNYLKSQEVDKIDYLVATHPHSDHIGSMDYIISRRDIDIGKIVMGKLHESVTPTSPAYQSFLQAVKNKNMKIKITGSGDEYDLGDGCVVKVLGPTEPVEDLNENSLVMKLNYKDFSMLFGGDTGIEAENKMISEGIDVSADVMTAAHHGSSGSTSANYLKKVNPEYAVISCGVDNAYGHPHDKTLQRLAKNKVKVYRTDLDGTVVIATDGQTIEFKTSGKK